jgi:type I restriction enzyme, S subunit
MAFWPKVRMEDVLRRAAETIVPSAEQEYREVTVKLWGRGVVQRRTVRGGELNGTRRFVARTGQFIVSRIDARNGATGVVPPELDGALVTNDFPLFDVDRAKIETSFLHWLSKTPAFVELCRRASEGTTNRVRLREDRFLALEIPLPALAEQRRIVAVVDGLAAKVTEARTLRRQEAEELERLARALLFSDSSAPPTPMADLVRLREPDVDVRPEDSYQFAGVFSFGRGVFRAQVRTGLEFSYPRLTRLHEADFVYPKLMAWEGAFGVVPANCHGCVVSTEFPVFEIDQRRVLPEVVDTYYGTPSVWEKISGASPGTNVRRRRLNPKAFLRHAMPLPEMAAQLRLQVVKRKSDMILQTQAENAPKLEAALASILDKAFKGEL